MLLLSLLSVASAETDFAGYFRVMTRPDFQGGDGRLGYWNLYGRLLNEGPYAAVELRQDVLSRKAGGTEPWTDLHAKVEGGSIGNADAGNGSLANLRLSQVYAQAGNVLLRDVTWRLGTLEYTYGDLGLYDLRPAQVLFDTVGLSGRYQRGPVDLLLGLGDAGYALHGSEYNTVLSGGGAARVAVVPSHLEIGIGGQLWREPEVKGNRYAPHDTPGVAYEDYLRGEVVERWLEENPNQEEGFPDPTPTDARSWKAVAYLGFGGFGPVRWNNLFANVQQVHPETRVTETWEGRDYDIYVRSLTDERRRIEAGDELQLSLVPERLDLVAAGLVGVYTDGDNDLAPSDDDRTYWSTVGRGQVYLSPTVHLLAEGSYAVETSHNGNAYRDHVDSLFENTAGKADADGLEYGDSDTRTTVQGKGGVVLSPLGPGLWTRPTLRVLYGVQWSSQNNAFGNSFVETLDQYNEFGNTERHWHSVLALEAEAWF